MYRLIWISVLSVFYVTHAQNSTYDVEDYKLLIIDVRKFYEASNIFLLFNSGNSQDLYYTTLIHSWIHDFSQQGIPTCVVTFDNINRAEFYYQRIVKPLFVVGLTSEDAFIEFANVTQTFDTSFPAWFIVFLDLDKKYSHDHCHYPNDNVFNIRFDSEFMVLCSHDPILREWYSLDGIETIMYEIATWYPNERFTPTTNLSFCDRRNNLKGIPIKGVTLKGSTDPGKYESQHLGLYTGILSELSEVMNFSINYIDVVNYSGSLDNNSCEWNGAIAELLSDRADMIIADMSMTSMRLNVVDFTMPLAFAQYILYMKDPGAFGVQWYGYFQVFSFKLWLALTVLIITTPLFISIILYRYYPGAKSIDILSDSYLNVWGIFCQQGTQGYPKFCPLRLAYLSILLTAMVASAAYSASLICHLTISVSAPPFRSLKEFLNDGSYCVAVIKNSADYDFFKYSDFKDSFSKRTFDLIKQPQQLPETMEEAFSQVCRERVGFYSAVPVRDSYVSYIPCPITKIAVDQIDSMSYALQKGSPYSRLMNCVLQKFINNGILNRYKSITMQKTNTKNEEHQPVEFVNIVPILALYTSGVILSVVLLLAELLLYKSNYSK